MSRHFLGVVLVAACLSALPSSASAALIEIDFESFSDLDVLTNQIAGVTFTNATVLTSGAIGGSLNEIDFPPTSGFNVVFDSGGPMTISFLNPVESFQSLITHAGGLDISYFGLGGTLLGGSVSGLSNVGGNDVFSSSGLTGISFLTITGDAAGFSFALDDLSFNTIEDVDPIPEPSTLLLVGTGAAALLRRRYKRRVLRT